MSAAIRRLRRPWTVLSRAWGSFVPTAHNPMGGIRPCGPNKRPSERLSSQTRKTCPRRPPFAIHGGGWTVPAPIMAIMSAADTSCRIRSAFFRNGSFTGRRITPVSPVTRIQSPIKEKALKKRLSPKSPNTLIHQCVTFYVFLIFQYLSLWKSVFSSN